MRFLYWSLLCFLIIFLMSGICALFGWFHLGDGGVLPAFLSAPILGALIAFLNPKRQ